jgi:DNA repair photolyase
VFSGVTDAWQPIEAAKRLTRGCLEVCHIHRNPVSIVTKSSLIRRDVDLLATMARAGGVSVAISIPFLDETIGRAIEPGAPTVNRRFETIRALADAGIRTGIAVAPLVPGLGDADVPGLLRRAADCGASFAFRILLRLPGCSREVFLERLRLRLPGRAARVEARIRDTRGGQLNESRFGRRFTGEGRYWEAIDALWHLAARRAGLEPRPIDPAEAG